MNAELMNLRAEMAAEMLDPRGRSQGFGPDEDYPFDGFGVD